MSQLVTPNRMNNFSTLRILFAILVILSHSFELIDGNRSREILTRVFGTISFGVLAVDGFFVVSGYLITKSYISSEPLAYLLKRVLRIYPGFIVAFILSIALCEYVSPHLSAITKGEIYDDIFNLVFLMSPYIKTAYPGSFYPAPNGAMWTISYEFHCYLLIMLLAFFGLFKNRKILLAITIFALIAYLIHPDKYMPYAVMDSSSSIHVHIGVGARIIDKVKSISIESPKDDFRFFGIFLVGSCFYIFRNIITFRPRYAAVAAVLLISCLFSKHLAEPGLAVFGGYLIFWFALHVEALSISKFFNENDLSYGIYLYAWPTQKVLISRIPHITTYSLFFSTLILCLILAYLSWILIEKPILNLKGLYRPKDTNVRQIIEGT